MSENPEVKIYNVSLWRRLPWMIVIPILMLGYLVLFFQITVFTIFSLKAGSNLGSLIFPAVPLILTGILFAIILIPFGMSFYSTSYLKITPEGLDYNLLPAIRHQCKWDDLEG